MNQRGLIRRAAALILTVILAVPDTVAAWGEKASAIVIVAHTTKLKGILAWWANLYNDSLFFFSLLTVESIVVAGIILGLIADVLIGRTGIDLRSRDLHEH